MSLSIIVNILLSLIKLSLTILSFSLNKNVSIKVLNDNNLNVSFIFQPIIQIIYLRN